MRNFCEVVDIHASPARVWEVLLDVERWPEWTASMTSVRRLDSGPFRIGSRARVLQPKLASAVWEVTDFDERGRSFTWVSRQPGVRTTARHDVEANGAVSRVTLWVEFSGLLAPVIAFLTGKLTARYIAMEAGGLKARCEP
jgi:uncharacterized membrane protein